MRKKENVLLGLNIILVIGLIVTLVLGVKHYKQISNNSSIEEYQINNMVNTVNKEANTEESSEIKVEEKINIQDENKNNEIEGDNSSASSSKKVSYKASNNNSGYTTKSSKKVQAPIETPKKEETKPIEVVNEENAISVEDKSKVDNAGTNNQPSNSSDNQSEKTIEKPVVNEDKNPESSNTTVNTPPNSNEIEGNSPNEGQSKEQN